MIQLAAPLWRLVSSQYALPLDRVTRAHVDAVLDSDALRLQRNLLERLGLSIDPQPALWKYLPGPFLRLFLRVQGQTPAIEEGEVIAVVLLHDPQRGQTLYAHPVHAGSFANPLLGHLYGPMASPKAQEGPNGDRATLRLLEHKRAIWDQFLIDRDNMRPEDAGQLWRDRYFWSLVRLYFCERCPGCTWGSPFFEGVEGESFRPQRVERPSVRIAAELSDAFFDRLRQSAAWNVETAYVRRGGREVDAAPRLAARLAGNMVVAAFPTDAELIEAGTPVGVAYYADATSASVRHAHVLTVGPEPEPPLMHGERALGLPPPRGDGTSDEARAAYAKWREHGWSQYWLRELEEGLSAASESWLLGYWDALAQLFGVNPDCPPSQ